MAITDLTQVPTDINRGLTSAKQTTMLSAIGNPRGDYNDTCQEVTHPTMRTLIETRSVGPFRARGLRPALDALTTIFHDIAREHPDIHAGLGTQGMLCARFVRGSTSAISNHSWGTAIDLTLDGVLDTRGDNRVQVGLVRIAPVFNRHGWFWGAGFRIEDAMHFEASDELIRRWHGEGRLGAVAAGTGGAVTLPESVLTLGDRGPEVAALQERLNQKDGAGLVVDGVFGPGTRAAVISFQARAGLRPDGVVGPATRAALAA